VSGSRFRIVICRGPDCGDKRGSRDLRACFAKEAADLGASHLIELDWWSCFGRCSQGPNVLVRPVPTRPESFLSAPATRGPRTALYNGVTITSDAVRRIIQSHVIQGILLPDLVRAPEAKYPPTAPLGTKPADPGKGGGDGGESR
jgi:(2Fe-2S) ferredoxin